MRWLLALVCAGLACAQSGIPSFALNTFGRTIDFRVRNSAALVLDAAFAAEERTSSGGSMKVYRDQAGRTRVEQAQTPTLVEIHDPQRGVFYVLDTIQRTAYKVEYERPETPKPGPLEPLNPLGASGFLGQAPPPVERIEVAEQAEALGQRLFDGIEAAGKRVTVTYPPNSMGNAEPLVITQETWFATSIQATMLAIQRHPQTGEIRTELVSVRAGEPDAALFRVPEGYTISDQPVLFRVALVDTPR